MNCIKLFVFLFNLFFITCAKANVIDYFNQIKNDPNKLYIFFKEMPKGGELHYHLAGGPYPETMIRIASKNNYCLNKISLAATTTANDCDGITIKNLLNDPKLYTEVLRSWSMKDFIPGKESGHDRFFNSFNKFMPIVVENKPPLIANVLKRAAQQQELYLEIMDIPDNANSLNFAGLIRNGTSWDNKKNILLTNKNFQKNINQAVLNTELMFNQARQVLGCKQKPQKLECQIKIKLIYYALREQPLDKVFVQALSAFESVSRSKGNIVGVNLVEAEDGYISLRDYHKQMLLYNYLHNLYPKVPISLHAGELSPKTTKPKDLSSHIRDALITGKANRIGHGVDIRFEEDPETALKYMAKNQIPVEINLISNLKILDITGKQHPLNYYLQNQVPIVLSTDDEGILRTNLTRQYVEATLVHGLDYQDLKQINRNALTFAFLPGKSIWADSNKGNLIQNCLNLNSNSCQEFIKNNEKATLQWNLEQKLISFESQF